MKITSFLILVVLSVLITACGTTEVTNNETSANLEESDIEVVTSEPIENISTIVLEVFSNSTSA